MTTRVGHFRSSYDWWEWTGFNFQNVVLGRLQMPQNGWITRAGVHASGYQENTLGAVVLYNEGGAGGELLHASESQNWDTVLAPRTTEIPGGGLEVWRDEVVQVGLWAHPDKRRRFSTILTSASPGAHRRATSGANNAPPAAVEALAIAENALGAWFDFVPNEKPLKGAWAGDFPAGVIGSDRPLFEGTMPHPAGEGGRDHSAVVRFRVYDKNRGGIVHEQFYEPSAQERANGRFSTRLFVHEPGHDYWAEYAHQDKWGVWSEPSERTHYEQRPGPTKPSFPAVAMQGKVDAVTGLSYHANYVHEQARPYHSARVEIWNADHTVLLHDSGWRAGVGPSADGVIRIDQWHPALAWGRGYAYRVKTRDNLLQESNWSHRRDYRTNTAPAVPTSLAPSGGRANGRGVLSATVSDRDGDPITQVRFWVYTAAGALLAGFPKAVAVPAGSDRATIDVSASLVLGTRYRWECDAFDGTLRSAVSGQVEFVHQQVPEVGLFFPSAAGLTNAAVPPSAEYPATSGRVSLGGTDTVKGFAVVPDVGAFSGKFVWELTKGGGVPGGTLDFALADRRPAAAGERWFFAVGMKLVSGALSARLVLDCFDAAGALVASVAPQAGAGSMNAATAVSPVWAYHGNVTDVALPAGTANVRPRVVADGAADSGVARVDGWQLIKLPASSAAPVADFAAKIKRWLGFFDGDFGGYGTGAEAGGYGWAAASLAGASPSVGLNILTTGAASVFIGYSSPAGTAKVDDRVLVQQWVGGKWLQVHAPGLTASARTEIPIPASAHKNEGRYRLKVFVHDTNSVEGESEWAYYDVRLAGPPELVVRQVGEDPARAELSASWEPSALDPTRFAFIEVAVASQEEGLVRIERFTDQGVTGARYPWPVSGRRYRVKVRQGELDPATGEVIESRWAGGEASVDYFPMYFLKDVEDPDLMVSFRPLKGEIPGSTGQAPIDEYLPIIGPAGDHGAGGKAPPKPYHVIGEHRYEDGSFKARFWDDPLVGSLPRSGARAAAFDQYGSVKEMDEGSRFCCFLGHVPASKNFLVLKSISYAISDLEEPDIDVEWTETTYSEDVYERGGF